jgi:hypothetical protein
MNKMTPLAEWTEAERIRDLPEVDEALRNFLEDAPGDNATCIVRAVMRAVAPGVPPSHELDAAGVPKLDLTLLEQKAIATLNTIKAWRDSDGNAPFPDDAREGMELALMLAAARRKGVR